MPLRQLLASLHHRAWEILWVVLLACTLTQSGVPSRDPVERVRAFTRSAEFDFAAWTLDAAALKLGQLGLGAANYLAEADRRSLVLEYGRLVDEAAQAERRILEVYADPSQTDPEAAARPIRVELASIQVRQAGLRPLAEAVLEEQVTVVLADLGLTVGGEPIPPVAFHFSKLPLALIVSPRDVIRQDADVQLETDLGLDEQVALEGRVEDSLGVSALVVPVGGVGTYPTMVQETGALGWAAEVVAHEWVHNYLTLRPLGMLYTESPEMRVINETTASIAGEEIGLETLKLFYPELVPQPPAPTPPPGQAPMEPPAFDFRKEMNITRVTADKLLAEGKIEEAEEYMDSRRIVFWENGYRGLRKLNQAYFAFHGAYADEPGGAAGAAEDPVGEAVRLLRQQSASLEEFLTRISWVTSFDQLQEMVSAGSSPYPG
jgi:hypothetical protein